MNSVFWQLRDDYHREICNRIWGLRPNSQAYSNADKHSGPSTDLAARMADNIRHTKCRTLPSPQGAGTLFRDITLAFLQAAFDRLQHLRPGPWDFQVEAGVSKFEQYEHLAELDRFLKEHRKLEAALGSDYLITPDIVIARRPLSDAAINISGEPIVLDDSVARHAPLRRSNRENPRPILHAIVSCKWTMRSDRAQNTRTEALNLIRNRKGRTPHIAVVTFEPMPTRVASIAMGTGDVDCTYHSALHELVDAASESGNESEEDVLAQLVDGRRLRDISDLPLDLAV